MSITEEGEMGELEKGEVPHAMEDDVKDPRWKRASSRTYYYKVPPRY